MPKNRFRFFRGHLCFDNAKEIPELWKTDRFAFIRQTWELFNSNMNKYVIPSKYLPTDETLYPMRYQIAFRQCNLSDARFPYTYKSIPYPYSLCFLLHAWHFQSKWKAHFLLETQKRYFKVLIFFGWNLTKALALPYVLRRTWFSRRWIPQFLGIALRVSEPASNIENIYEWTDKHGKHIQMNRQTWKTHTNEQTNMENIYKWTDKHGKHIQMNRQTLKTCANEQTKGRCKMYDDDCWSKSEISQEQCQSCDKSIFRVRSMRICNSCLQWHSSLM